jgi:hypothetical protein
LRSWRVRAVYRHVSGAGDRQQPRPAAYVIIAAVITLVVLLRTGETAFAPLQWSAGLGFARAYLDLQDKLLAALDRPLTTSVQAAVSQRQYALVIKPIAVFGRADFQLFPEVPTDAFGISIPELLASGSAVSVRCGRTTTV